MTTRLCIKCGMKLIKVNWQMFCPNCGVIPINQNIPHTKPKDKIPSYIK